MPAPSQMRHALALEHEPLSWLRPRGNGEPGLAVEDRHVHLVTQAHLGIGQGQGADDVGAVALEDLVRAYLDEDVEIAGERRGGHLHPRR